MHDAQLVKRKEEKKPIVLQRKLTSRRLSIRATFHESKKKGAEGFRVGLVEMTHVSNSVRGDRDQLVKVL